MAFLPKVTCDVRKVEIGRGVRLTASTVDQFTIRVPRTRTEYFQDDLYPLTPVTWKPVQSAQEWFDGCQSKEREKVDLRPTDMKPCEPPPPHTHTHTHTDIGAYLPLATHTHTHTVSEAPAPKQAPRKFESYNPKFKTDQEKKDEVRSHDRSCDWCIEVM